MKAPSSAFRSEAVESYTVIIGIGRRGQKADGAVLINSAGRPGGGTADHGRSGACLGAAVRRR